MVLLLEGGAARPHQDVRDLLSLCPTLCLRVSTACARLIDSVDVPNTRRMYRDSYLPKELDSCLRKTFDALLLQTMGVPTRYTSTKDEKRPIGIQRQSVAKKEVQIQVEQGREYVFQTLKARSSSGEIRMRHWLHAQAERPLVCRKLTLICFENRCYFYVKCDYIPDV